MQLLGLTGGVGMGKSACADLLRQRNIPVIDTDQLARQVVEPGQPALLEIRQSFGTAVFHPNGHLRREALAERVFSDTSARQSLEQILHPRIRRLWQDQTQAWRTHDHPIGAVAIPLLFETKAESQFDAIICIACSNITQHARLQARGWSDHQISQRIHAQMPIDQKIARANRVIWTEGSLVVHAAQLDLILAAYAA